MTAEPTKPSARLRQLAVLGASADLATARELENATEIGRELARRGFVCVTAGDDGVMGAAARAAKNAGGSVLGILPRGKEVSEPGFFDAIVQTGLNWVQFSDVLLQSCCAALVVGGGAGTLGELAAMYLSKTPGAFVGGESSLAIRFGGQPLDERELTDFPVFDNPADALDHVVAQVAAAEGTDSGAHAAAARALHLESYPFERGNFYLQAAERFREAAALISPQEHPDEWAELRARHLDSIADHAYYNIDDFLQAAAHYGRSLACTSDMEAEEPVRAAFRAYLRAILLESVAFGLYQVGEYEMAHTIATSSAARYAEAIDVSPADEHRFLIHSSHGLAGAAAVFEAANQVEAGLFVEAWEALRRARTEYVAALDAHPGWGEGYSSDNYHRSLARITELESRIARGHDSAGALP